MSTLPLPTNQAGPTLWTRLVSGLPTLLNSLLAVAIALLAGGVVIALSGQNPIPAYEALFAGAFGGQRAIAETLVAATPLILGGLAFAVAARAGMFNIGIEGQLVIGSLVAALVAAAGWNLPQVIYAPLALIIGGIAGGIWGGLAGLLETQTGAGGGVT